MSYLERSSEFLADKQCHSSVEGPVQPVNYGFLTKNRAMIDQEFKHLYAVISKTTTVSPNLRKRCAYYCALLQQYHLSHGDLDKAKEYESKYEIINSDDPHAPPIKSGKPLLDHAYEFLGNANMLRLQYAFGRVSVKQALLFAQELQWMDAQIDLNNMVTVINAPGSVFNVLSLGLFACRLSINISQIIKHTRFPTDEERNTFSAWERFCQEVYDRQYHLLNDIVWGTVNLFCNYNAFWNLSDLFAGELTSIFLVFDAVWLMWSLHLIEETYLIKKAQYEAEQKQFSKSEDLTCDQRQKEISLLNDQLAELELEWQFNQANLSFSIGAAAVFTAGYSATLLFAAPAAIIFSWLICNVAVAMYLSADEYAKYQQTSYQLSIIKSGDDASQAEKERDDAGKAFIFAMIKNTVMPLFVTTCFAICWPVALAGTVIYISHYLLANTTVPSSPRSNLGVNDSSSDDESDAPDGYHPMFAH